MNKKHSPSPRPVASARPATAHKGLSSRTACRLTYALGFLALLAFTTWGYADVFTRAEQESYISTGSDTLYYLLSQPLGHLYWLTRWPLTLFKWAWLGGPLLALVWTLTAWLTDRALRLPRPLWGLGFVVPLAQMGWIVWRGTNLYYKTEPSLFVAIALGLLLVAALAAGLGALARRFKRRLSGAAEAIVPTSAPSRWSALPWTAFVLVVLIGGATWGARRFNENEILTARLQNLAAEQRWDDMIDLALAARQPSRAVAAYHAIALTETDRLLDGLFAIPYEFPKVRLDLHDGSEEYGLFVADANYHAGLINAAYRGAMDRTVMDGPRLCYLKRMAICALLNGEKALCRKYLILIGRCPFEEDFVAKYTALLDHPERIDDDAELKHVRSLAPREDRFEQNYQAPAFLGYNVGLETGSDATLQTSAAACLYSKDLGRFLPRAQIMAQKGMTFPAAMQQAIAIMALKDPSMLELFQKQVGPYVGDEIRAFLVDAKPYVKDRLALRHNLREKWIGTYVYYYYTENNDPDQVAQPESSHDKAGVN